MILPTSKESKMTLSPPVGIADPAPADASFDPASLPAGPGPSDTEAEVRDRLDALRAAVVGGEPQALDVLLDVSFIGVGFAGQVVDKALYVGIHAKAGGGEGQFGEFIVEDVVVLTRSSLAYVHGVQRVSARIRLRSRFVQVWTRTGPDWLLVFHQETPIVDPASVASNY
jgi:hypothetical protein